MVVQVDAPNDDPAEIEHPIVLPVLLLEDVHDSENAKSENPPPPPPKLEISLGDVMLWSLGELKISGRLNPNERMNVFTFKRWWIQTFLRGKCLPTYGRGTVPLQLLSNTFIMHVTGIDGPLGVRGMTCNIS
jgi:hypothetical protein